MQSIAEKKPKSRDRILEAASQVFAQYGIKGATTLEIARVAGVNECTLFRNFQSKELLLKAVVEAFVIKMNEALYDDPELWTGNLKEDLFHYITTYHRLIESNEPMLRMFIGEGKRQPDEAGQVVQCAGRPIRQKLCDYLRKAQEEGKVRKDLHLESTADALTGMVSIGILRRGILQIEYSPQEYLRSCIDIFISGIAEPGYH